MTLGWARWGRMDSCMMTSTFLHTLRGSWGEEQVGVQPAPPRTPHQQGLGRPRPSPLRPTAQGEAALPCA